MDYKVIKSVRQIAGLSQSELAEAVGVDRSLISKIETGATPLQCHTKEAILKAVGKAGVSLADCIALHTIYQNRKLKQHQESKEETVQKNLKNWGVINDRK
ncbi:helix-turn-helix domain-containing protein [Fictibacillus sp. NPDC058756]|uniref:helix-turn-helix domain-containing protein n=1 Tax=Fictibacillus sp. NPDC058756 TaxID=3346625 RepID=UPI0036C26CF3